MQAHEVQLLAASRSGSAQVVVQKPASDEPCAVAHAVQDGARADIRETSASCPAAEGVDEERENKYAGEEAARHRRDALAHARFNRQLFVFDGRQRRTQHQIPVRENIAADHRRERRGGNGRHFKRTQHALGRERRGHREDAADRHRDVEQVLAPRAFVVEAARRSEHARQKRQRRKQEYVEPARTRKPLAHLVRVAPPDFVQHFAYGLEVGSGRGGSRQEVVRRPVGDQQEPGRGKNEVDDRQHVIVAPGLYGHDY